MVRATLIALAISAAAVAQEAPAPAAGPQRLSLEDAVKLAFQRNPDLQRQVLLSLSAEQDRVIARSAILPLVSFNASLNENRNNGPVLVAGGVTVTPSVVQLTTHNTTFSAGLRVSQLIFDGGKWWNNIEAANLAHDSNVAQVDEQRLQIAYLVEQRFYELVRAQRQLQVLADAAARSRDQADFSQRLFEGGRATQADVYAARANRDSDEVSRLGQERAVELARVDLALAIGTDPAQPLTIAEPQQLMTDPAAPPPASEAVSHALELRPSIKAAALLVDSNRKTATAAHGDYWPQLYGTAGWSRLTSQGSTYVEAPGRDSQAFIGLSLVWNGLFNGFNTTATVRKAEITALLSENDLQTARRNVASDVQKAVAQLGTARAQARVAQQSEQTAKEGLRLARTRQEVGVGTQLEVRDAELKLTQAQLSVVGSLVDGREAESALRRAQGG